MSDPTPPLEFHELSALVVRDVETAERVIVPTLEENLDEAELSRLIDSVLAAGSGG